MEGALDLEPFRYRDVKVSQLHLTLKGDAQRQDFRGLLEGNFGKVNVDSRGHLLPLGEGGHEIKGELTLRTEKFQPALLGLPEYTGTDLNSSFTGTFLLPPDYSITQLYLAGDLTANGRLYNEPLKSLQAKFVLSGERIDIARAEMRLASGDATVKGMISRSAVDLTFTAAIASSRNLPVRTRGEFFFPDSQRHDPGSLEVPADKPGGAGPAACFSGSNPAIGRPEGQPVRLAPSIRQPGAPGDQSPDQSRHLLAPRS